MGFLADEEWAALEPLVEACRPHRKTQHHDLRQMIEAIVWRCRNGAKGRAVPAELRPWWRATQTFIRSGRLGVWERLLGLAQEKGIALGMVHLDGTTIRAHAKAAGARNPQRGSERGKRGAGQALGRSRGGYGTKACVICDGRGLAIAFALGPGQAQELPTAYGLPERLPARPLHVVCDRGYASYAFRQHVWAMGAKPTIPPKRTDPPVRCDTYIYRNRNVVERLWGRLTKWRAVATRYEKTAVSFLAVLSLAAALDWLRN